MINFEDTYRIKFYVHKLDLAPIEQPRHKSLSISIPAEPALMNLNVLWSMK